MTKCPACGESLERWEARCTRCAVASSAPDSWPILTADQSPGYRLTRAISMAAGGALAGAIAAFIALGILALLPLILGGEALALVQIVVAIAGIVGALIGFAAIPVSVREFHMNSTFEISKDAIRFDDHPDPSGPEAKFFEREFDLAAVREIRIEQGWLARLLGYGDIEIFTDRGPEAAAVIPGVSRPQAFRDKFDLILVHRTPATLRFDGETQHLD